MDQWWWCDGVFPLWQKVNLLWGSCWYRLHLHLLGLKRWLALYSLLFEIAKNQFWGIALLELLCKRTCHRIHKEKLNRIRLQLQRKGHLWWNGTQLELVGTEDEGCESPALRKYSRYIQRRYQREECARQLNKSVECSGRWDEGPWPWFLHTPDWHLYSTRMLQHFN